MGRPRLISPERLARRLGDPGLAVLEVARDDDGTAFGEAHIPGSRWAFWKDLLWHETDRSFAEPDTLARRLGATGIARNATVVLVGDPIQFGTYAFWVLGMRSRCDVLLLDGGRAAWLARGMPVESGVSRQQGLAEHPASEADDRACVGRDGVLAAVREGTHVLLDLRSPEEYRGERVAPYSAPFDHGAERKGRIPGARHLFYRDLLREDESFREPAALRAAFATAGVRPDDRVVTYCRLAHRGSLGWYVLTELLGHRDVRVYDGSWTEWGSVVGMPIER